MRTFPDKISHREIRFDDSAILAPPSATFCTNTLVFVQNSNPPGSRLASEPDQSKNATQGDVFTLVTPPGKTLDGYNNLLRYLFYHQLHPVKSKIMTGFEPSGFGSLR